MKDRVVQYPNRYKLTLVAGTADTYDLEAVPGTVTDAGTPLNKAALLSDPVGTRYGMTNGTPSEAFEKIVQEMTCTVPASGWSAEAGEDGWFTNQVSVEDMKAVYNPVLDLVITSAALAEDEKSAFSVIAECETFDGYVIFKALEAAEIAINVRFLGV